MSGDFSSAVQLLDINADRKELLRAALLVHGHVCGGMPLGFIAGEAALKALGVDREKNMDKIVILESGNNHAAGCFADGVQIATGCTFGKGIMQKTPKGKFSFLLIDKTRNLAVRVRIRNEVVTAAFDSPFVKDFRKKGIKPSDIPEDIAVQMLKKPFGTETAQLLETTEPFPYAYKEPPLVFNLVQCENCGEVCAENYSRLQNNRKLCLDCWPYE